MLRASLLWLLPLTSLLPAYAAGPSSGAWVALGAEAAGALSLEGLKGPLPSLEGGYRLGPWTFSLAYTPGPPGFALRAGAASDLLLGDRPATLDLGLGFRFGTKLPLFYLGLFLSPVRLLLEVEVERGLPRYRPFLGLGVFLPTP